MKDDYMEQIFWCHHKLAEVEFLKNSVRMGTWFRNLCFFFGDRTSPNYKDDRQFMRYYLHTNMSATIQFLVANIILLLLAAYIVGMKHIATVIPIPLDPAFDSYQGAVVEYGIWIILSLLCLAHHVILLLCPSLFGNIFLSNECDVWYEIGAAILVTRFLSLVMLIANMLSSNDTCMDAADLIGTLGHSFGYMFIKMSMGAFQTFAFAMLPFPQPWAVFFSLLELVRQELRLLTCADRISKVPTNYWVVQMTAFLLAMVYITLVIVPSVYLENSVRNRFRRRQLQQSAETAKKEMISFLSSDVRVPLQYMFHALTSLDFKELLPGDTVELMGAVHGLSKSVSDVADDLLLLVRIQEGRYRTKRTLVSDLRTLIEGIAQETHKPAQRPAGSNAPWLPAYWDEPPVSVLMASDVAITVDERCLLVLLRHVLAFMQQLRPEDDDTLIGPTDGPPVTASARRANNDRPVLEIAAMVNPAPVTGGLHALTHVLVLRLRSAAVEQVEWTQARRVHEATTAYICNTIAASCGGTFEAQGHAYTLQLPCERAATVITAAGLTSARSMDASDAMSQFANDEASAFGESVVEPFTSRSGHSHGANANGSSGSGEHRNPFLAITHDRAELDERIRQSETMQARFRKQRVCVIAQDEVLRSVVVAVLRRLHLDEGMMPPMFLLPAGEYVPVAKLTFVTAFSVAEELRTRKYSGRVVLFSGSASYLDEEQASLVDYCLPLPSSDHHLTQFVDWLIEVYQEEVRQGGGREGGTVSERGSQPSISRAQSGLRSRLPLPQVLEGDEEGDNPADPLAVLLLPGQLLLQVAVRLVAWWQEVRSMLSGPIFVGRLPPGTLESYYKWRLLNPARAWYHQSTELFLTVFPRLLVAVVLEMLILHNAAALSLYSIATEVLFLTVGVVYTYALKPLRLRVSTYWMFVTALGPILFLYMMFFGLFTEPAKERNLSLDEFLVTVFDGYRTGAEYLYSQMMTSAFMRLYSIYNAYPLNILAVVLVFARSSQLNVVAMRALLSAQMTQYLQLVFFQLFVINLMFVVYIENTYRGEFKTVHKHILTKAFLDQCLDVCQQNIRRPLAQLVQRQEELTGLIVDAVLRRRLCLDRIVLHRLEPWHVSRAVFAEMVRELDYSRGPSSLTPSQLGCTETVMLTRAVARIISSFSSALENHYIRIYAEVDIRLTVIQVDWRVLSTLLTNLIHTALRNIRRFCIDEPRNLDLVNYILVKIVAVEPPAGERVPVSTPRTMLINVCDSSNTAIRDVRAVERQRVLEASPDYYRQMRRAPSTTAADMDATADPYGSKYGRSVCAKLVHSAARVTSGEPVFQTIAVDAQLGTVQRLTFPYHITHETRLVKEFVETETDRSFLTVTACVSDYLSAYCRVMLVNAPLKVSRMGASASAARSQKSQAGARPGNHKELVYFSGAAAAQRGEVGKLIKQLDAAGWNSTVKYILSIPSARSVEGVDCVLIDQQLEVQEGVSICNIVLKLRACGYNGVVAVLLQEGLRFFRAIKEQLERSAAETDLVLLAPMTDAHIKQLTEALKRRVVRQLVYMNGN